MIDLRRHLTFIITLCQVLLSKQIQVKFNTPKYGTFIPEIPLCLGTPNQCFSYILDITSSITFVPIEDVYARFKSVYNFKESTSYKGTFHMETVKYKNCEILVTRGNDTLNFPGTITETIKPEVTLAFIDKIKGPEDDFDIDGIFGLSRHHDEKYGKNYKHWSIMEALISKELFKEKTFAITYQSSTNGILYMGERPVGFNQKDSYGRCNCNKTINEWNCPINMVYLNDKKVILNTPKNNIQTHVIFNSSTHWLKAPEDQGKQLFKIYVKESEQQCRMETDFNETYLLCNMEQNLNSLPDLHFILDEKQSKSITLKAKEIFRLVTINEGDKYKSNWIASPDYDHWQIGMIILKNHDMLFSSGEDDEVFFIDNFRLAGRGILLYGKLTLLIIALIVICGLLYLAIRIFFLNKKQQQPFSTKVESLLHAEMAQKDSKEDESGIKL